MQAMKDDLWKRIENFDFDDGQPVLSFTQRLARENGWSIYFTRRVLDEYKRFAYLAMVSGHPVTPSEQVDQAWHLHLVYTRSYWEDFCGQVLGRPLHHGPTNGGSTEQGKYREWYERTKSSYVRHFGVEPPGDVWPDSDTRFGTDLRCRRVNIDQNWVVPKASRLAALMTVAVILLALFATRSGHPAPDLRNFESVAGLILPNPLELPGPEFLLLYVVGFIVAVLMALIVRIRMSEVEDESFPSEPNLDPYEIAYLAGGDTAAVNAAYASVANRGVFDIDPVKRQLVHRAGKPMHEFAYAAEHEVASRIVSRGGISYGELRDGWPWINQIEERLREQGLIVNARRDKIGRVIPVSLVLLLPALAMLKIHQGLEREMPVQYLVITCFASVFVGFAGFGRKLHRTQRGNRLLKRLQQAHCELRQRVDLTNDAQLPMAVGLFGLAVLPHGPLDELKGVLSQRADSAASGGCSGDSDGGCGGCGCGGCG